MKKRYTLKLICVIVVFAMMNTYMSCNKDDNNEPELSARGKILTDSIWRYYEYYKDFQTDESELVWKTNRTQNTLDLSKNKVKYNKDGSYWEITETGETLKGTWKFNADETQITVQAEGGTAFVSDIRVLTPNQYEWEVVNGTTYGVMMKRFPTTDKSKTAAQLLTATKWKYGAYFNNYANPTADLVWRLGKPNNTYALLDSLIIEYKANGAVVETYKDGTIVNGTWTLSNNDTRLTVSNAGGDWISDIKVLNQSLLEWNRIDDSYYYYGVQVPVDSSRVTARRR